MLGWKLELLNPTGDQKQTIIVVEHHRHIFFLYIHILLTFDALQVFWNRLKCKKDLLCISM